ncbi:unnamed protein product [Cladocopium goreaui]|uniref:Uncharacterized protein n=1 Tax=Cladocopium goreaui TaxID=2562237 RepID=A0A9P1G4M6_9DINO|nr:unnamed protein product [Cladocopium goreaui]
MVAEPSDPKGGPLVRAPRFQVMLTSMALWMALMMVAADGGGRELGALGMAESFVNMPMEPKAMEHHRWSCRKFEAYDLGDAERQGEGQREAGRWYSRGNGEAWNLVNENLVKEIEPNDKHGKMNHFLEMNEYDMMDYEQHLVINEFKIFDGAWFLVNVVYMHGFAHCLDYIDFIDSKILGYHYMNNYVDTVFNGWQCLVKYAFKVSIFILRFFLYMVDKVMAMWYSGLAQLAAMCLCSFSWTRSTSRAMASLALSWMASMPMALAQELRGKELQFGLMAVILVCITWNNNQQFQLNNVKMFLSVQFQVTIMQVMLTLILQQNEIDFKTQMTNVNKLNKKFLPMHMSPQHPMEKVLDLKMSQNEMMVEFLFLLFLLYVHYRLIPKWKHHSQSSTSPTATSMAEIRSGMVLGGVLMLMMGMLVMMFPRAASRSRSRDDPQPKYANVQQWTSEMRNFLATTFVLSAKAYWIDGQHDQFSFENMFNHLRLAALLMKNDEKEAVEYFTTAVEVNDPEEIMAQVRNMRMCMDLPHVNLLHAEAWLWEEFRDDLQRKADASDGAFFVPIVEHRWDTPPGESDRGGDEDAASSRSSIANRSGDENVRESPAREFELRMTMNLPRSEAIQVAQTIADAHGRELVVERPAGSDEREHGDRDGQEPEPGSSNNNTLGRSSENTTLNSRTTQNTTEEENDKIEQAMAEARASLRRGIRVLQSRATRYEELGDHEAAEEVRRQIDDMEAMESSS